MSNVACFQTLHLLLLLFSTVAACSFCPWQVPLLSKLWLNCVNTVVASDPHSHTTSCLPCTCCRLMLAALFESYHLRHDVAIQAFNKLPVLQGFPVSAVPRAPYPGDSKLYTAIRQRVRKEVFAGTENRGQHRKGSELAALAVLTFAVASYVLYARYTGWLAGLILGESYLVQGDSLSKILAVPEGKPVLYLWTSYLAVATTDICRSRTAGTLCHGIMYCSVY